MDDVLIVEIGDGADQLGKHAADEGGSEEVTMASGDVKEVATGVVAEHEDGPTWLNAPCLEVHERWVAHCLHELKLALEAHLDAVLGCPSSGAMLADFDGYQGPAFVREMFLNARVAVFVI